MFINEQNTAPAPRPIPERECKCGCGHNFQPKRKDQVYLNKQHADYAYNHGPRKRKQAKRLEVEQILRKNDLILGKYYELYKKKNLTCYLNNLLADGFYSNYHVGHDKKEETTIYYSYNYSFKLFLKEEKKMITITKL